MAARSSNSLSSGTTSFVAKDELLQMLQELLGSEEVSDILDHLLSIDSSTSTDDVSEYLTSLLGGASVKLSSFVSRLEAYQANGGMQGEAERSFAGATTNQQTIANRVSAKSAAHLASDGPDILRVLPSTANAEAKTTSQFPPSTVPQVATFASNAKPKTRIKISSNTGTKMKKTGISVAKVGNVSSGIKKTTTSKQKISNSSTKGTQNVPPDEKVTTKSKPEPKLPQKGPPPPECGCFGMIHKCLTNCLHCGRIACAKEGYGYCCFCHNLIEDPSHYLTTKDSQNMNPAQRHKERLLKFDRDLAQRTTTFDEDIVNNTNSTSVWLNSEERRAAEEQETARRKALHDRSTTMQLQLGDF